MTNKDYHTHKAIGTSGIKQLLENPHAFIAGIRKEETAAMRLGTVVHKLVLEPHDFYNEIAIYPEFDARTKEGKAIRDAFNEEHGHKTIIKQDDYEVAQNCAEAVRKAIAPFLKSGKPEQTYISEIDGISVKCRPDWHNDELGIVVDLKVVADASPDGFAKAVANFGYYIQEAVYTDVMRSLEIDVQKFVFVAVEKEPPYMVGIYSLSPEAVDFGRSEYRRGLDIFRRLDEFKQPIYKDTVTGDVVQTITLPSYVYYRNNVSY